MLKFKAEKQLELIIKISSQKKKIKISKCRRMQTRIPEILFKMDVAWWWALSNKVLSLFFCR